MNLLEKKIPIGDVIKYGSIILPLWFGGIKGWEKVKHLTGQIEMLNAKLDKLDIVVEAFEDAAKHPEH